MEAQANKGDPIPLILVLARETVQLFYFLVETYGEQAAYHLSGHDGLCSSSWALQDKILVSKSSIAAGSTLPLELTLIGGGGRLRFSVLGFCRYEPLNREMAWANTLIPNSIATDSYSLGFGCVLRFRLVSK